MANPPPRSLHRPCALIHRDAAGSLWLIPPGPGAGYIYDVVSNVGKLETDGLGLQQLLFEAARRPWQFVPELPWNLPAPLQGQQRHFASIRLRRPLRHNLLGQPRARKQLADAEMAAQAAGYAADAVRPWSFAQLAASWARFPLKPRLDFQGLQGVTGSLQFAREGAGLSTSLRHWRLSSGSVTTSRAGVNNLFGKSPPIIPSDSNTCPTSSARQHLPGDVGNAEGRYIYFGMSIYSSTLAAAAAAAGRNPGTAASAGAAGHNHLPGRTVIIAGQRTARHRRRFRRRHHLRRQPRAWLVKRKPPKTTGGGPYIFAAAFSSGHGVVNFPSPMLDDRTAGVIRTALEAAQAGRIEEARAIGEKGLSAGCEAGPLHAMIGSFYVQRRDFAASLAHLERAREACPMIRSLSETLRQHSSNAGGSTMLSPS